VITQLQDLAELTANPAAAGLRAVVAAGGDGTVAAVVNRTPAETPLAVLPLGTENLLAKYMHMSVSPWQLSRAILHGATVRIDAGQAGDQIFLLMAGCGFDADVVQRLHAKRSGHIHHLSYVKPIVDSIRKYQYPPLRVRYDCDVQPREAADVDDSHVSGSFTARWLFVVNLPRYAGGLRLAPAAIGTDGLLDVVGFTKGSLLAGLRYLYGVVRGKHLRWSDCRFVRVTRLRVESEMPVPYQLDGDPGGQLPVQITVVPERVRLIVTESWAVHRGFRHLACTTKRKNEADQ
jgi:diacylglycerol kinase family enzyme